MDVDVLTPICTLNLTVYLVRWKEEWIQSQRIRQKTHFCSIHQVTDKYQIQCRLLALNSNPIPFHKLWALYASDELGLWRWIKYLLYVCYEGPQQKEFSVFFLSPIQCKALHIKDTQEKITDKFDLLRLQIPAFILMTLQNTFRTLFKSAWKSLPFDSVSPPLAFSMWLNKLHIETTKSSSDFKHFWECLCGKVGTLYWSALIYLWKKKKKQSQETSLHKTHHYWY